MTCRLWHRSAVWIMFFSCNQQLTKLSGSKHNVREGVWNRLGKKLAPGQAQYLPDKRERCWFLCGFWTDLSGGINGGSLIFLQSLPESPPCHLPKHDLDKNVHKCCFFLFWFWLRGVFVVALGLLLLWDTGSRAPRLSSCIYQAFLVAALRLSCPVASGISVSGPGMELVSPALGGRFLITGQPGKSLHKCSFMANLWISLLPPWCITQEFWSLYQHPLCQTSASWLFVQPG